MSYRIILVHADLSPHAAARIRLAASLARAHGAHLLGVAMTGVSRFAYAGKVDLERTAIAGHVDALQQHAAQALAQFEEIARDAGAGSHEARLVADDPEGGLVQQSRFCDLLVLSQADPDYATPDTARDLPGNVMLNASRPVLLAPYAGAAVDIDGPAVIAWNGSRECAHAVAGALPLLRRAARVVVAHFDAGEPDPEGVQSSELLVWLERHGIRAVLEQRPGGHDVGAALLALVAEQRAALIVMGGYGRTRFRELLLGGVTRSVLQDAPVPVLMSH